MERLGESYPPIGGLIDRIKASLQETLAHLDSPGSDPSSSPLLHLSLTSYEHESNSPNLNPASWSASLVDVGNLLVDLAVRYQEQTALLKTSHTSALLKHQVETRRLQEKTAQDQKTLIAQNELLETLRAENGILQDQIRHEQLSSTSKLDVLHQRIVMLEGSLHTAEEKLKAAANEQIASKAAAMTANGVSSGLTSRSSSSALVSDTESSESGINEEESRVEALERDLRIANDLLRKEHEKFERSETDLKRATGDLERLKAHLITIQSDIDEKEMTFQEEIERLTSERDELKLNHDESTETTHERSTGDLTSSEINEYERSLENAQIRIGELEEELEVQTSRFEAEISTLEASLVQMRADQQTEVELHTMSLQGQVAGLKEHIARTEAALAKIEKECLEKDKTLQSLFEVGLELQEERSRREAVEFDNENLKMALNDAAGRLSIASEGRDSMVAKPLVAKIFSTYLNPSTSASSKSELLHLMANILELTDEERRPLGIPLIKPPEGVPVGSVPATPARGLVSMISSATGSMITGSVNKGKQWLAWGRSTNSNPTPQPPPASNGAVAATPSLSDIWIKILLEGSEVNPQSPAPQPVETRDVFKVPTQPLAPASSAAAPALSNAPSLSYAPIAHASYAAPSAPPPQTPVSSATQRMTTYQPAARPEPSQSPYLAQQQAIRSQFLSRPSQTAPTATPPPLTENPSR